MNWSSEKGMAMVATMFMVVVLSLLGSSLMFVSGTETMSSLNYETMSQTRYAAESAVHSAANYILWTYVPPGTAGDPLVNYDLTQSPVRFNNADVVLSSDPAVASNYPVGAVTAAFNVAAAGALDVGNGSATFTATARLMSMRQINDAFTGTPITLQTWQITGTGSRAGAGNGTLQVTATIERQDTPVYKYAAFATDNGCDAMKFGGGGHTSSYDSRTYNGVGAPANDQWGGNVGTNGNLDEVGNTTAIMGSLSTPRTGVGACNANNVTALTVAAGATLSAGITQLSQGITFPIPPAPNPLPPTGNVDFNKNGGCPGGVQYCAASADGATITPPTAATTVTLGDVRANANSVLHLSAGIYVVNSITLNGNASLVIDGNGPVIIRVAGQNSNTPIDLTGGNVSNLTYKPTALQFIYGGTDAVKMAGGAASASLLYAPQAQLTMAGGADWYGAVVAGTVKDMGGMTLHYDRALQNDALTAGNPTMTAFSWRSY